MFMCFLGPALEANVNNKITPPGQNPPPPPGPGRNRAKTIDFRKEMDIRTILSYPSVQSHPVQQRAYRLNPQEI